MSSASAPDDRPYDIVLYGATSFVGRYVVEYFLKCPPNSCRWAMAGRNPKKLESLRQSLRSKWPHVADVNILIADAAELTSLRDLAAQTQVICTTVGPYARYGEGLVAACVDAGTHYCDLTGEIQFIRRMMDRHHEAAKARGVRIVHACGFDSIPSDMGTYFLQEQVKKKFGRSCERVQLYVKSARGGFSGGTIASGLGLMEESRDPEVRRWLADPYSLNPADARTGEDDADSVKPQFDAQVRAWVLPFFMGPINKRVVRRSHALAGKPYGDDFRYNEWLQTGRGWWSKLAAFGIAGGTALFFAAAQFSAMRVVMKKSILPAPGEGPRREKVESGHFSIELVGYLSGQTDPAMRVIFRGNRDPGYGATAVMFAESALCLAQDQAELSSTGGVLTPAYAMGDALLKRLRNNACFTIEAHL